MYPTWDLKAFTNLSTSRSYVIEKSNKLNIQAESKRDIRCANKKNIFFFVQCINISLPFKYLDFVDKHRQN